MLVVVLGEFRGVRCVGGMGMGVRLVAQSFRPGDMLKSKRT